jgi:hypothetical protein
MQVWWAKSECVIGADRPSMPVSGKSATGDEAVMNHPAFAKTILLVEPSEPFLGTTRLDKLPYHNVDLTQFYPYGSPAFSI